MKWTTSGETDEVLTPLLVKNLTDPSFKGSVLAKDNFVAMKTIAFKGKYRWKFLEQTAFSYSEAMMFNRFNYLYSTFNEKINQLITGGFLHHWQEKWTKHRIITEKPPPPDPVVLDMEHLSIGFKIWLIMLGISTMAFIIEIVHHWGPKLYDLIIFHYILSMFYKKSKKY